MKVRVPKEHRPPTRFGIIVGECEEEKGRCYRVSGAYRRPRKGEPFWGAFVSDVVTSTGACSLPRVILEEVK